MSINQLACQSLETVEEILRTLFGKYAASTIIRMVWFMDGPPDTRFKMLQKFCDIGEKLENMCGKGRAKIIIENFNVMGSAPGDLCQSLESYIKCGEILEKTFEKNNEYRIIIQLIKPWEWKPNKVDQWVLRNSSPSPEKFKDLDILLENLWSDLKRKSSWKPPGKDVQDVNDMMVKVDDMYRRTERSYGPIAAGFLLQKIMDKNLPFEDDIGILQEFLDIGEDLKTLDLNETATLLERSNLLHGGEEYYREDIPESNYREEKVKKVIQQIDVTLSLGDIVYQLMKFSPNEKAPLAKYTRRYGEDIANILVSKIVEMEELMSKDAVEKELQSLMNGGVKTGVYIYKLWKSTLNLWLKKGMSVILVSPFLDKQRLEDVLILMIKNRGYGGTVEIYVRNPTEIKFGKKTCLKTLKEHAKTFYKDHVGNNQLDNFVENIYTKIKGIDCTQGKYFHCKFVAAIEDKVASVLVTSANFTEAHFETYSNGGGNMDTVYYVTMGTEEFVENYMQDLESM